jgi:hypothetical protein
VVSERAQPTRRDIHSLLQSKVSDKIILQQYTRVCVIVVLRTGLQSVKRVRDLENYAIYWKVCFMIYMCEYTHILV